MTEPDTTGEFANVLHDDAVDAWNGHRPVEEALETDFKKKWRENFARRLNKLYDRWLESGER